MTTAQELIDQVANEQQPRPAPPLGLEFLYEDELGIELAPTGQQLPTPPTPPLTSGEYRRLGITFLTTGAVLGACGLAGGFLFTPGSDAWIGSISLFGIGLTYLSCGFLTLTTKP